MPRGGANGFHEVRSEKRRAALFKKGNRVGAVGRPKGAKHKITEIQQRFLASTGMTPLQFFALVYRDELYEEYEFKKLKTVNGETITVPLPKPGTKKIKVEVSHRLSAANSLAPYMHKRMPIAIEMPSREPVFLSAEKLARLNERELSALLNLMDRLGIGEEGPALARQSHLPHVQALDLSQAESAVVSDQ